MKNQQASLMTVIEKVIEDTTKGNNTKLLMDCVDITDVVRKMPFTNAVEVVTFSHGVRIFSDQIIDIDAIGCFTAINLGGVKNTFKIETQ